VRLLWRLLSALLTRLFPFLFLSLGFTAVLSVSCPQPRGGRPLLKAPCSCFLTIQFFNGGSSSFDSPVPFSPSPFEPFFFAYQCLTLSDLTLLHNPLLPGLLPNLGFAIAFSSGLGRDAEVRKLRLFGFSSNPFFPFAPYSPTHPGPRLLALSFAISLLY